MTIKGFPALVVKQQGGHRKQAALKKPAYAGKNRPPRVGEMTELEEVVGFKPANDDIMKELENDDVIALDSLGILTGKDIRAALKAVKQCEAGRDETEEQDHIKTLQRQRAARMYGG
jgi:hypothetical protein